MRLGFAVKVLGRPQLKTHDSRRWQNRPHLSVSLAYLRDILLYLQEVEIRMYRMVSDLAPYVAHPEMETFHHQVSECAKELAHVGQLARGSDIRLSFHTTPYVVLNSPDEGVACTSAQKLAALAQILDSMGLDRRAVIVTHVGGVYGDKETSLWRFAQRFEHLPEIVRSRLCLENDEQRYALPDVYRIHEATGIRLIFDRLHFLLNNPDRMSVREGLLLALPTWPADITPKVHFSSPRTEMRALPETAVSGEAVPEAVRSLPWRSHSDYINPFEFVDFLQDAEGTRDFDVMLEAKAKDLAVLRLRKDLAQLAPERFLVGDR